MKRVLSLFLAALMAISLAACQNSEQADGTTGTTSATNATDATSGETIPDTTVPEETQPGPKVLYLCTEETLTYSDGGGSVTTRTYDEKGNLLTDFYKSKSGDVGYGESYTYDEKGNVLTYKTYDNHSRLSSETTKTYNEAGQLISQLFTSSEGAAYTTKSDFFYDEKGLLVKKVDTNPEDTNSPVHSEFHYVYTYDEKGNLIKEDWINVNDGVQTPHSWKAWTYDAKGNKLSETDNRGFKTEWTYDDRGNMLSEMQYDSDGFAMVGTVYTYDAQNRILTETWCKGDIIEGSETYEYEYDSAGNRIYRYRYMFGDSKEGLTPNVKYTYDAAGNLITEEAYGKLKEYKYIAIELPKE